MYTSQGSQGESSSSYETAYDKNFLWLQDNHRSSKIFEEKDYDYSMKYYRNAPWALEDVRVRQIVTDAGFGCIQSYGSTILDHALLKALGERWRRETHTFLMRGGEITVTLQDVAMILGVPIDGEPVIAVNTDEDLHDMCDRLLGASSNYSRNKKVKSVKSKWLVTNFQDLPQNPTQDQIIFQARAYILYALGMLFFPDASGNTVNLKYLPLLEDVNAIGGYSWGSAILAGLYSALCECTVHAGIHTFKGCAILLQIWSWEHFHVGRPVMKMFYEVHLKCFASFWYGDKNFTQSLKSSQLQLYRDEFDNQEHSQVIWRPYDDERVAQVVHICTEGAHIYRSTVPLFWFSVIEYYRPERVMHQLEGIFYIPPEVDRTTDDLHDKSRVRSMFNVMLQQWEDRENRQFEPEPCTAEEYTAWYSRVTRKIVMRPLERDTCAILEEDVLPSSTIQETEYKPRGSQMTYQMQLVTEAAIRDTREAASHVIRYGDRGSQKWLRQRANNMRSLGLHEELDGILNEFDGLSILPDNVSPPPLEGSSSRRVRFRRDNLG